MYRAPPRARRLQPPHNLRPHTARKAGALTLLALRIRKQGHRSDHAIPCPPRATPPSLCCPVPQQADPRGDFLASGFLSQPMGGPGVGAGVTSSQPLTTAAPCFCPGGGGSLPLLAGTSWPVPGCLGTPWSFPDICPHLQRQVSLNLPGCICFVSDPWLAQSLGTTPTATKRCVQDSNPQHRAPGSSL